MAIHNLNFMTQRQIFHREFKSPPHLISESGVEIKREQRSPAL